MESYSRRSKNVLSLNWILFFFIELFLTSCKNKAQITPPILEKITVEISDPRNPCDSILHWCTNNIYYRKIDDTLFKNNVENISMILKKYSIKNGRLYFKEKLLDKVCINFYIENDFSKSIIVNKGIPDMNYHYRISYVPSYIFSDNGGFVPMYHHLNIFKTGHGYWKEYYLVDYYKNRDFENIEKKALIKEEGKVKHNFKFGEWKYYNREGKIDSVKTYTLKDSVDVRFPHCIFNKNEPCY